jgi:hypothetical protein
VVGFCEHGDEPSGSIRRRGKVAGDLKLTTTPASSAEVKNAWIYTPVPPIRLHDVVLN